MYWKALNCPRGYKVHISFSTKEKAEKAQKDLNKVNPKLNTMVMLLDVYEKDVEFTVPGKANSERWCLLEEEE